MKKRVGFQIKKGFIFMVLLTGFLVWSCANQVVNSNRTTPTHEPASAAKTAQNIEYHPIVGTWKKVAEGGVDEKGNKVDISEMPTLSFGKKDDDEEPKEPNYDGMGMSFNSVGEVFSEGLEIGSLYEVRDSLLIMGREWIIKELTDEKLVMYEAPGDLMPLLGYYDMVTFERVNKEDRPSNTPMIRKLIIGKWESHKLMATTVEGNMLFGFRERVTDTLKVVKDQVFEFTFDADKYSFGPKGSSVAGTFDYVIVDSTISLKTGETINQILKISQDSLSILMPFDRGQNRLQYNLVRVKE